MIKKLVFVALIIALVIVVLSVLLKKPNKSNNPVNAIPKSSSIIIKANGILTLATSVTDNHFYQNAFNDSIRHQFSSFKFSIDSFSKENSSIKRVLTDSSIYISIHYNKDKSKGINTYLPFGTLTDFDIVAAKFYFFLKKRGIELYKYNPAEALNAKANALFYFTEKGILVLGTNLINIKEAYAQVKSSENLYSDSSFSKVIKTTGKNVGGSIFINMNKIQFLFKEVFKAEHIKPIQNTLSAKGWFAMDINFDLNNISFHGFSDLKSTNQIWIRLLKNELPSSNAITSIMPKSTSFFSLLTANDFYNYKIAYKEKLKKDPDFSKDINKIKNVFGEKIDEKLLDITNGSIASCFCTVNGEIYKYVIITTKSSVEPLTFINSFHKTTKNKTEKNISSEDDTIGIKSVLLKLPGNNLPVLFGELFQNSEYSYIANYKNYIIFGESDTKLKYLIENLNSANMLINDSAYRQILTGSMASKSNISMYFKFSGIKQLAGNYFTDNFLRFINKNIFDKTCKSAAGIQVSGNGNYFYNNVFFYSEPALNEGPELVWSYKLDTIPENAPIVLASGQKSYYFVQDKNFNIYLLSSNGLLIWKKNVDGKILSTIQEINFYGNTKKQILFNTSSSLYIINIDGDYIKGFPHKFRLKATNGITVMDFDNDKNYRYYVAFEDKSFDALDKNGKKIKGWKFDKTKSLVTKPALCFSFQKKDYIVVFDSSNIHLLNRKGENRIKIKQEFQFSQNSEITLLKRASFFKLFIPDYYGINEIYPDAHLGKTKFDSFSKSHFAFIQDIDNDQKPDYFITDSNTINCFNSEKEKVFTFNVTGKIDHKPIMLNDNDGKGYIAFSTESKVYMIDMKGKILKGFPINGNFPVNVLSLYDVSYSFALFTSSNENINCYFIR